ncbi:MAG: peroxiredoxin [Dehalococcoidia bacterium]|nr:peroxiredoxin [Dehalococcoidia bacterium]
MLPVGSPAPEVTGELDDSTPFRLSNFRGKQAVVLYFYPKDFTGGCTRQACSFRDNFGEITRRGALLVGISSDDTGSHAAFRDKHHLPVPLLADVGGAAFAAYGAKGPFGLGKARVTYVIDREGIIRAVIRHDLRIGQHVPDVVAALDALPAA